MEMIMISDRKLKVMLSAEDLDTFGVNTEDLDYANTETKRMLWDILSQAKGSVGFQTDGHRVLFQIFPCRKGGCEIFVTKLSASESGKENAPPDLYAEPILHGKQARRASLSWEQRGAFGFDSLDWLLTVCQRLASIGYGGESAAYIGDNRRYYLILDGMDTTGYLPLDEFSFIKEYGTAEPTEAALHFLSEHASPICPSDAVGILGTL